MTAREDLDQAITADAHGLLVTKWILVAEVMDAENRKIMEINGSTDLAPWDGIGLLSVALGRAIGRVA